MNNRTYNISPERFRQGSSNTITVYNDSEENIPAWRAVRPGEVLSHDPVSGKVVFSAVIAENDDVPWGIVTTTVAPGGYGKLLMTGIIPAWITGGEYGDSVVPVDGWLYPAASGRAELLIPTAENLPGLVLLGAGGGDGGSGEYQGQFKVELKDSVSCRVCWGIAPDSAVCGFSDVPGFGDGIPVTETGIPESGKLYLNFDRNEEEDCYVLRIDGNNDGVLSKQLCSFEKDVEGNVTGVTQLYTGNDGINFSREYFL